jgi:hypothetical protein
MPKSTGTAKKHTNNINIYFNPSRSNSMSKNPTIDQYKFTVLNALDNRERTLVSSHTPGWGGGKWSEHDLVELSSIFGQMYQACNFKNNFSVLDKPSPSERKRNEKMMATCSKANRLIWDDFEEMERIGKKHD